MSVSNFCNCSAVSPSTVERLAAASVDLSSSVSVCAVYATVAPLPRPVVPQPACCPHPLLRLRPPPRATQPAGYPTSSKQVASC